MTEKDFSAALTTVARALLELENLMSPVELLDNGDVQKPTIFSPDIKSGLVDIIDTAPTPTQVTSN